jgi:hypothetical protein
MQQNEGGPLPSEGVGLASSPSLVGGARALRATGKLIERFNVDRTLS